MTNTFLQKAYKKNYSMKEYYVDLKISNELESWILLQGAKASRSDLLPLVHRGKIGSFEDHPVVVFGHRRIHFWTDGTGRVFFNDENISTALLLFVKFPDLIIKHTIPREPNGHHNV